MTSACYCGFAGKNNEAKYLSAGKLVTRSRRASKLRWWLSWIIFPFTSNFHIGLCNPVSTFPMHASNQTSNFQHRVVVPLDSSSSFSQLLCTRSAPGCDYCYSIPMFARCSTFRATFLFITFSLLCWLFIIVLRFGPFILPFFVVVAATLGPRLF